MTRTITVLIVLLVLISAFLVIRYAKDSYKILPIDEQNPLTADSSNFLNWREFQPQVGNFKALFPTLPQHITDKVADPLTKEPRKFDMYVSADENGTAYTASITTFPNEIDEKNVEVVLRSVVDNILKRNKDNKLKYANIGNFHQHHSLDFSVDNGKVTIAGKAFLVGNTMYVLSILDKTASFKKQEFDFFTNSFDIVNPNEKLIPKPKTEKIY